VDGDEVIIRAGGRVTMGMKIVHESKVRMGLDGEPGDESEGELGDRIQIAIGQDEVQDYVDNEVQLGSAHAIDAEAMTEWQHNQWIQEGDSAQDVREKLDNTPGLEKQLVPVLEEGLAERGRKTHSRPYPPAS